MSLDLRQVPPRPLVAASILSADFATMAQECQDVLGRGADLLHLDVMDGHFVPNLTMGPDMCRALRKHFPQTVLDVHLMVEEPQRYLPMFADAGASLFCFHWEVTQEARFAAPNAPEALQLIEQIHARGLLAGMAINPPTAADGLLPLLAALDLVLVMSVNPGRSGQKFIPQVLDKVRLLKSHLPGHTRLEVDGGINVATAPAAVAAGADVLVTASALFGAQDRGAVIQQLHQAGSA